MNKTITLLGVAALLSMTGMAQKTGNEIHIDFAKKGAEVPAGMFGIFFEEINHSGEGGLYAELVQNRAFEDTSVPEGYTVRDGQLFDVYRRSRIPLAVDGDPCLEPGTNSRFGGGYEPV